jgi:chromosome segregation ATPase
MARHSFATAALLAAILSVQSPVTHAQVQRSGGEQQKFMQQYQQLAGEKTALQAQIAQMKKDLDSANAALAAMKKEHDALKARPAGISPTLVAQATASKDAAERSLSESRQRMTELVGRFRETAANFKDVEADRNKLRAELEARNNAFDKCAADNQQLYDINGDALNRLAHVGLFTKVSAEEPFTRITRTRMDNLVVETRARAEELRVKKRSP